MAEYAHIKNGKIFRRLNLDSAKVPTHKTYLIPIIRNPQPPFDPTIETIKEVVTIEPTRVVISTVVVQKTKTLVELETVLLEHIDREAERKILQKTRSFGNNTTQEDSLAERINALTHLNKFERIKAGGGTLSAIELSIETKSQKLIDDVDAILQNSIKNSNRIKNAGTKALKTAAFRNRTWPSAIRQTGPSANTGV